MNSEMDFSREQLDQIEAIENAVEQLLSVMLTKPAYLLRPNEDPRPNLYAWPNTLKFADRIAEILVYSGCSPVYFPITVHENGTDEGYVSDTYD